MIWTSPLIPADPLVWRKRLSDEQKNRLREFFMSYGAKPAEKEILAALQWAPFRASDNDQLLPIRQLELFKKRSEVAADAKLSDSDRQAQLQGIDQELAKLEQRMAEREQKNAAAKAS